MVSFIEGIAMKERAARDASSRPDASREEGKTQHGDGSWGSVVGNLTKAMAAKIDTKEDLSSPHGSRRAVICQHPYV